MILVTENTEAAQSSLSQARFLRELCATSVFSVTQFIS